MNYGRKQAREAERQRKQINRARRIKIEKAAPALLEALKATDKWLQQNTKASNRPATLDKQIMEAIAQANVE